MLILIGPSASGKTEVAKIIIEKYNMKRIVTYTTRSPRVGEVDGIAYNFVSKEKFLEMKEDNEFIETVCYNGNYYGTNKKDVSNDKIVVLDPNGLKSLYEKMPNDIISFYLCTNEKERINRMLFRQDKLEDINNRIENDRIAFKYVEHADYKISNENITLLDLADKIYKIYNDDLRSKKMKVLVETSARHVHVNEETFKVLFGENVTLTKKKDLSQPGQFACNERVTVVGPKKEIANVSILGPFRNANQVELSATDCRSIGLDCVVRESGDTANTPGCTLVGPCGSVTLNEGVIVAKRHIHMTPVQAKEMGVSDKQVVSVKIDSNGRSLVFGDVVCRVSEKFALAMHIDTDESNAGLVAPGTMGEVIK